MKQVQKALFVTVIIMFVLLFYQASAFSNTADEDSSIGLAGGIKLSNLPVGSKVIDITWEWEHRTGNDYSYVEADLTKPVTWLVVAKNHYSGGDGGSIIDNADHVTLISEELVCKHRFDNSTNRKNDWGDNNWGESGTPNATKGLRKFLNGSSYQGDDTNYYEHTFYDAMSSNFQNAILTTTIPTGWGQTDDKIFVPSARELGQEYGISPPLQADWGYFTEDSKRAAALKGVNSTYWTRSPSGPNNITWLVDSGGSLYSSNLISDYRSWVGVRPVVNLKSDTIVSETPNADGVYTINWTEESIKSLRLSGSDRFQTAIAISKDSYPVAKSADAVVISRSHNFADALPGGVLAYKENGPLLLTSTEALRAEVQAEISRVLKDNGIIYILGGTAAISSATQTELENMNMGGYTVKRIAGGTRTETAYKIAQEVGGASGKAIVAYSGNFPDALAISSYAAMEGIPILTTGSATLSADAAKFLDDYNVQQVYVVGGEGVISSTAFSQTEALVGAGNVERLGGSNRYDTARLIANKFFPAPTKVTLACGGDFPDALAGGVNAARQEAPILLVNTGTIPSEIEAYLTDKRNSLENIIVYGGKAVINDSVIIEAENLIK